MIDGYTRFKLPGDEWGEVEVVRILPRDGDIWGVFAPLKDTPWGDQLPTVSGESLSHALHGMTTPFMTEVGRPPYVLLKRIPEGYRRCNMWDGCISYREALCQPCRKLPDCYEPPDLDPEATQCANFLARMWKEEVYVVLVEGAEFRLGQGRVKGGGC